MDGNKGGKASQKKSKTVPEESSGEDGVLQIDVDASKITKKGSGKKQTDGAKPKKKGSATVTPAQWGIGDIVWAKVSGFVHWPAKVFDPNSDLIPSYMRDPPKPNYSLVRFLGTYDIQWASSRQIEAYEDGLKKRLHTKSRSRLFAKALAEVKVFLEKGELPRDMDEKPPLPDSQEESEGEEEEGGEEEKIIEKVTKPPAKAGTKRKAASKVTSRGSRKVKVLDTEDGDNASSDKKKHDEENGEKKT